METITTKEQLISKTKEAIASESQRIEECALYSSKGHFAAASFWANLHLFIGIPIVIMAAIASSSFISGNNFLGAVFAIIITCLSALQTFLNPNERSSSHLSAGHNYDAILSEVRIFRTITCWGKDTDQVLTDKLINFASRKDRLNHSSPQIPWFAYQKGKRGIEAGEGSYTIDKDNIKEQIPSVSKKQIEIVREKEA